MIDRWICPKFPGRQNISKVIRGTDRFREFREAEFASCLKESAKYKKKKRHLSSTKTRLDFYRYDRKMSFQSKRTE